MQPDNPFSLASEHRPPGGRHKDAPKGPVPYIPAPELVEAVNLAIHLRRPLLLEGEAGSGKSRLAEYVADRLGLPLYRWLVRSTSGAQDGLYSYDAILRLHDVHLARRLWRRPRAGRNPEEPMDYVTFGALGEAFRVKDCSGVVLIDEIDKADLDFPNDLLTVLDEPREFRIREADIDSVREHHPPIVLITSNKEKGNLPAPFLRRCLYYYLRFPDDPGRLKEIVDAHYDDRLVTDRAGVHPAPHPELVRAAISRFLKVREKRDLFKLPGTSELLDWLKALSRRLAAEGRDRSNAMAGLIGELADESRPPPCPEVLFKRHEDWINQVLKP
jgi:MoxR-like ATPase